MRHGHDRADERSAAGTGPALAVEGGTSTAVFLAYWERVLVPTLAPGQVVVLDDLAAHRSRRVAEVVHAAGCQLVYLPAYSPDLNPIEEAFAKVKAGCAPPGRAPAPPWTAPSPTRSVPSRPPTPEAGWPTPAAALDRCEHCCEAFGTSSVARRRAPPTGRVRTWAAWAVDPDELA